MNVTRSKRTKKKNPEGYEVPIELLQPWSTFVLKTKLPPEVLEEMIRITDEIVENKESAMSHGGQLVGQIEDEFVIETEILKVPISHSNQKKLIEFFLEMCKFYVIKAQCQSHPFNKEKWIKEEWSTYITSMWMVSQKDNEYNPIHTHEHCHLSTVMYLKIPEYLPSRKTNRNEDGCIVFTNNVARDVFWGVPTITLKPQVGDFFIFPASQQHFVYPFRSPDGKGERRSVSFNAGFSTKTEQELILYKS